MNVLEKTISLIAPHSCVICSCEGTLLCAACEGSCLLRVPDRCYRCHRLTKQSSVCPSCRSSVKLSHLWVAAQYQDAAKEITRRLKFARARAGAATIAGIIDGVLPDLPADILVTHIPTANQRVRARGYDQAKLIAEHLCKLRNWRHKTLLVRTGRSRQVGAGRRERFKHLEKALQIRKNVDIQNKHILLIDDVTTTGATMEAAARVLRSEGAGKIDAAVFAQP